MLHLDIEGAACTPPHLITSINLARRYFAAWRSVANIGFVLSDRIRLTSLMVELHRPVAATTPEEPRGKRGKKLKKKSLVCIVKYGVS